MLQCSTNVQKESYNGKNYELAKIELTLTSWLDDACGRHITPTCQRPLALHFKPCIVIGCMLHNWMVFLDHLFDCDFDAMIEEPGRR